MKEILQQEQRITAKKRIAKQESFDNYFLNYLRKWLIIIILASGIENILTVIFSFFFSHQHLFKVGKFPVIRNKAPP